MATSGDNKRKSLLQEFVDENGTSGLNQNYVKNALKTGGGFGATAGGTYIDDEGYQYIKPFRKSGERGPNVYVGRQYGRNETTTITGPDGVNEWFENARFTLSSLSDYNDKNKDTYGRDYGSSFSSRISELMASAKDVEDYLVEHQEEITNFDDLYSSLAGYQNALMQYDVGNYSRKRYYSQWENEDSYNSYLSQLEELERLRNFDTASAQKELDDLNAVLEQAKQYQAQMDIYVSGSGAGKDESFYISALTKRNSLLKKYGYSDIDELEKTISQKNVDFHRATRFQSGEQLTNDAINAQDFEEYARMGAELSNPDHNSFAIGSWHPFDGEVQNKVTYSRDNYYNIIRAAKSGAHTDGDIIYHYMTDDEVKIHNYYLAKYGEEKADEYLDSIEEQLNARLASGMFEDLEGKTAQELVFGISAGIDQFGSGMKSLFSGEDYIPVSAIQIASQMVREDLADNGMKLPEAIGGASLGQVAYDAVTTGANMLPSILTSSLAGVLNPAAGAFTGAALLGASASGNAYQEMLNLGYDKGQARAYSVLVGASEAGLQYLLGGIGKLGGKVSGKVLAKLVSNVDNAFARTAIKIGGNMLSEGAEEYLQEILTPWFENLTLYTENEIELITPESLYSGLLGALTAGFMDGGSTVKGEINTYNTGKTLQKADISAERLARLGKTFSADSVAYQLAGRVNENTGAYTMGRLFNEIGATLTEQNQAEITKSLERKGVAHDDAVTISETLAAVVEGRTLSERQAAVLNANDVVSKTVMDVIINPNSTVNQRTQNYNDALMSLAREKAGKKATADTTASAEDVTGEPATPAEGKVTSPVDDVSERVLEASSDGKTVRKSSGEEVKIARIASTKDGKMTLKLDTGETVNAEDVSYASEGEALVYETVARLNTNVEAANALVDAYDPSMSAEVYARGIEEAYRYGMYNFSVKEMADKSSFASELTQVQRNTAYKLGQIFGSREVENQQAIIKKARAGTNAAKAEGKVHFDGDRSTLNERQSASLTALEKIADALGVQIYVFESEEVNGKRKGANGWFDPKDSSIHIDLYAGQSGESTMLFTAAHELTHFIRQWSPAKFKVLANFLMEQYGKKGVSVDILVRQQMEKARNNGRTISYATAYEEVVADSMETMLADGKVAENLALLKEKDQTLWGKIKEFFAEFTAKVQAVYKGMNPDSAEGRYVAEMKYAMEQLQALFTEGLVEASENYQGSFTPGKEGTVFTAEGEPVAQSTADGSVMLSMRTYEESGRDEFRKYLEKCVSSNRLTKTEMQEMLDGIEEIYQVCKKFKNKYAPFGTWSDAAVVRDTYGRPVFSVVTPNGEYKMNLDFSLVCKKRRTLDAVFNEMARRGIIDNFELGQKSVVKINEIIRKHGFETACALCFVDAKRFRQASMADQFVGLYNELVESLVPESKRGSIDRFNFGGNEKVAKVEGGIDTWADSALDFSHIDHVLATYAKGTVEYKSARYIKSSAEARKLLARGDFMSSAGFDAVKSQNKTILSLYNSKKGTGGPKAAFGDVQYMNEIIKKARSWTPAKAYAVGGVRIQSFSDYVPRMVFDYVQMIYDLAATKLPAHAYTKEALFAKQFGLTGVKINMSLIPAIAEGGIAPGLDAKGNYVWAGESFDFDTAKEIQNAEGYSENCGTICVGVSDLHIRKLLADPEIRMVIPYHKSGLNPIVAHMNRIAQFTDYTGSQNTLDRNGTKIAKDFDFDRALHSMGEKGDPKAVIKEYLDWCDSNGYTPKFSQFRDHPNYYKLIEDFTLYDKNGQYVPQREVRAVFPQADSAFGSMKELIEAGLQEDAVIEGKRDKTLSAIVDEIEQTLPKTEAEIPETEVKQADRDIEAEVKLSDRDYSYNALVSKPDMKVTTISGNVPKNRADVVYYAKKNAASFSKVSENGNPLVYVDDIDTEVMLSTKGLRHGLDRRFDVNAPVTLKAGEIIKNAIRINELTPDKDTVDASYVLIGAAKNEKNEPYIVQFVVNRATNEVTSVDVLYSVNAKTNAAEAIKKESTGSLSPEITDKSATLTDSNISIAELLDYVNKYFPDILPEEVLKHYGHDARPEGKLGENALFSDRNAELEKVNQVLEKENGKLREDVSYLKEMLKLQKTVTGGTKFTKSSVESAASYLMKYANARGDKAELAKRLNSFYEYIAKGEELTWESVKEEAAPAAEWLMDNLIQGMKVEYIYEEDLLEQDLIGQVYDSYWRVSTLRTVADVKQKEINRLKAHHANRMQELKDAHTESVNKLKQEYKANIEKLRKDYRNSVEHKQQEIKAAYQESRKKAVEGRRRTAMRHKIKDVVNELNTYLLKGTKDKHVMIGLQKAVASALDAVNMDTVGAEERIAKLNEELTRAKTPEKIKEIMGKIEHIQAMGDKMSDRLAGLKAAYAEIKDSDDPLIANSHDEVIEAKIEAVAASVGDTALRDMSLSQLEDVYELYKMVLTTIRNANKTFKAEKGKEIAVLGNNVMMEVEEAGGKKKLRIKGLDGVSKFMWNNLKPVYAFKAIGSKTLSRVFDSVRAGEDTWARDVSEAREYYLERSKKYGYDSWDFDKRYGFKSSSGMDFNLNLEQIMSLYAYSKREQALDHLERGGFVFDETTEVTIKTKLGIPLTFNPVEATAYNISPETLAKITGKLTKEQKAFVDEMQDYLSTTMGAKGNEVSLELYGVKLFKEKFYFPLKSATQFMAKAKEQQKGEVKIKNSGFSKETIRKANNPIVLTPFMDVWANHVNEMSMYHAFVLPMEDFYRVFNYKTPTSDTMPTESVEMYIQNAYGKGATAYIEQLLRDLNGGARSDPTAGFINNMMGRFKKGAVFASASVVIQQPSAIARALALVDSKYFVGKKMDSKKHAELWAEVKKYAPVAIIKEMGYFDTNMGKSTADFIKAKEYGSWRDKMTALVKDGGYRDEVLSKAPALADELAWCQIWEAVKRETMDKTSLRPGSEEFMLKAGERFTEVIVNTQVYDSVLSRSANMRSKDTGMKMATAFLAEPTTSINMIADALIQGKRGNVKYARSAIGAVIASQILNAILVSFVYAGRDDDEDETYWEKYLGSLTAEIKDSFNLFGYIPFVKDIVSIMKGYDVERSDISVISDLWKAGKQLSSDNLSAYRKVENFAGSIAQMFGLPVRNIMRDARGLYQTVESFMNGQHTTGAGIKYAVMGAITNETVSDTQQLYEAMLNDDEAHTERVRERFKDQSTVDSAIRKALRENDPRIHEAAVARNNGDVAEYTRIAKEIIAEGHFSQDLVVTAINAEINKLDQGESENSTSDKQVGMYKADDFAAAVIGGDAAMANAVRTDIIRTNVANGDTQAEAEMSFASSASSSLREEFLEGRISEQKAVQALVDYCGKDQEYAEDLVGDWIFRVKYGFEYSQKDEAYIRGELSATELKSILMETEGMDAEKADAQIQVYDWEADGYEHVTIARVQDYNDHCAALGVPKDIYLEIRYIQSNTENDKDENGKRINYSAVQKIMAEINSYNLTPAQKTAIAESIGWTEKTIRKYKLW